ncbi:Tankyrase-1 [Arthrobotrys entomopaga]|nr:Tankyrase-1 [Arthrobotrys entomopaga]
MSTLAITTSIQPLTFEPIENPASAFPKSPTQITVDTVEPGGKVETSKCWNEAKSRFRVKLGSTTSSRTANDDIIDRFLKNNDRIDKTISECEKLKATADRQYNHSTSSRFVGKLLGVLVVVKDIGDPLLQCAPESVSIAWSAISLLIGIGANDIENCGRISEACANIVTIILNCRLYETRYQNNEQKTGDEETEEAIIESIQELLCQILDFFWVANKKLRDKKIKRFFKEIFDSKVNEKYEELIAQYKALRKSTELAFQERVLDVLNSNETILKNINKDRAEINSVLFPSLKDIATKLDDLSLDVKNVLTELQIRDKFKADRKKLKPLDTHQKQLEATLQPLRYGTSHLCQWLFNHRYYKAWERIDPKAEKEKAQKATSAESKQNPKAQPEQSEIPVVLTPNLMYVKGRAGFGKSVMMALAVQRLKSGSGIITSEENRMQTEAPIQQSVEPSKQFEEYPVLYFFFKRGDDATQLTAKAYSSLLTQLFCDNYARTREEMEKFMAAVALIKENDSSSSQKRTEEDDENISKEKEVPPTVSNKDLLRIESIGKAIGKTIYILIDGIDECTDFESEGLVSDMISLARSKKAPFKVLLSSREDLNLDKQFIGDLDEESRATQDSTQGDVPNLADEIDLATNREGDTVDPFLCVRQGDTMILTVTKETNSEDMKAYLDESLRQLMKRRLPRMFYSNKNGRRNEVKSKRLLSDINKMVDSIQEKSEGMFTYSAMIITSLGQPSPMSLTDRLKNLPHGMDELYSRQLESLTGAERKLVTLALKRIIWSPADIGTVEIAEEFKQKYLGEHKTAAKEDGPDEYDDRSEDGSMDEDDIQADGQPKASKSHEESEQLQQRPSLHRHNTYPGENPIEKAMRSPEIADTIYHLEGVGRDFFKFANNKQTIGLIHKSVRDWVEKESEKAAKRDYGIKSIASLFAWDKHTDELKLTLPIPKIFVKGQGESIDFQSEKDEQLDILIYILRVLTHPAFYEVYMPYYPLKDPPATDPSPPEENPPATQTESEAQEEGHNEKKGDETGETEARDEIKEEEGVEIGIRGESDSAEIILPTPTDADGKCEGYANKEAQSEPGEAKSSQELTTNQGDGLPISEEQSVIKNSNDDVEPVPSDNIKSPETDPLPLENEPQENNDASDDSDNLHNESECDEANRLKEEEKVVEETFHKGPWRSEIHHWPQHMRRVTELWPKDERHGEKWLELYDLLRKFCQPLVFPRWDTQYSQYYWGYSLEEALATGFVTPLHMAAYLGLPLFFEFLLEEPGVEQDIKKVSVTKRSAIHYADILHYPDVIDVFLQRGGDLSLKNEDGQTPLVVLFEEIQDQGYPVDRNNERVKALIETLKKFLNWGANFNDLLASGDRPLQKIISLGDESLVDLVMARAEPKIDLSLADSSGRTALHTVWYSEGDNAFVYQVSIAKKLLAAGANPNAEDSRSRQPLADAVSARNKKGIELLLDPQYGPHVNDEDNDGKTVLINLVSSFSEKNPEMVITLFNLLVKNGADISIRDKEMWTALMWSIYYENWDIIRALLSIYADKYGDDHSYITLKNLNDRTMVHLASEWVGSGVQTAEVILGVLTPEEAREYLAIPDPSNGGKSAFHIAISGANLAVAEYLLERGADPLAADSDGHTPGEELTKIWSSNRVNPNDDLRSSNKLFIATKAPDTQNLYLNHAISTADVVTMELLAKNGATPASKDLENWDSFDWAFVSGQQELMSAHFPDAIVDYASRKIDSKSSFQPITGWDPSRSNTAIHFTEGVSDCRVELKEDSAYNDTAFLICANHPVNPYLSTFYYEVTILSLRPDNDTNISIGFGGEGYPVGCMLGLRHKNILSFGLHSSTGEITSSGGYLGECDPKPLASGVAKFGVGDIIGCGYDLENHTIFWTMNGKHLGVGSENVRSRLYPCIGATSPSWFTATTNFGGDPERPFVWDGDRSIIYNKQSKHDRVV